MNGKHNKWILKEGSMANGYGISVHEDLDKIDEEIDRSFLEGKTGLRDMVVMKYIENPLLKDSGEFKNHKMDLRMWVLVTDWDPITVWSYDECYFRCTYSSYQLESNDIAAHITNNIVYGKILA